MRDVEYLKRAQRYCGVRNPISHLFVPLLVLSLAWLTTSCGTTAQGAGSTTASTASLALTPDSATVASLQQLQFTARVSGSANTAVSWSASAGTISSSGVFTAPKVTSNTPVVISATSGTDSALPKDVTVAIGGSRASATVTVTPVIPSGSLAIASSALP